MRVLLPAVSPAQLARLQAAAPRAELVTYPYPDLKEAILQAPTAEVFYGHVTPELMRAAPGLRWVHGFRAGVDAYLFPEMLASPVVLTSAKAISAGHLADHVMTFILAFNRNLPHLWRCQAREVWETRANLRAMEMEDETLLIVGLGGTGLALARRAASFGMQVRAVTRSAKPASPGIAHIGAMGELAAELPRADHVAICCALTPETRGLFSDREFGLMKPTAFIHNIARGAIIDQPALVRALQAGRLAGAGLDVTDPEPLPAGHPLWHMPNVLITAHTSGHSPRVDERLFELFLENLRRYAAGEPLLNLVDKRVGA
ncbi:MAG: D-2-hydroxyacid dehydrogenase [Lacunisphaera sp.]